MSTIAPIIADLVALIDAVANTGPVYGYDRRGIAPELMGAAGGVVDAAYPRGYRVNYVTVDRRGTREEPSTQGDNAEVHDIVIAMYRELLDPGSGGGSSSRVLHVATVEAVRDALRATYETAEIETLWPPQVERDADQLTGGLVVLSETFTCHQTVLSVRAEARRAR